MTVASVVEGHGEVGAFPILIRKILGEAHGIHDAKILVPHRVPRGKFKSEAITKALLLQAGRVSAGGIIIAVDADDECALDIATTVRQRIPSEAIANVPVEVAVAVREYESWFLASMGSLRMHQSITRHATFHGDPDAPRNAKGRLEELMTESYRETIHQPAFSSLIDLDLAKASRSFEHLLNCVDRIVAAYVDGL
jgi:hypothetical protein